MGRIFANFAQKLMKGKGNMHIFSRSAAMPMTVLGLLSLTALPASAQLVYSNDFETNTNGFSSSSTTTLPTTNAGFGSTPSSTYLGQFSNDTVTLSLTGLTTGTTYTVGFDLFIGASWDGNAGTVGPDNWSLTAGVTPLVQTTFGNVSGSVQNYSDTNPIGPGSNPRLTGADVANPAGLFDSYGIYYFSRGAGNPNLTFLATGATETLTFAGSNLQGVSDEFWAIDNVTVTGAAPTAGVIPEPGTVALLASGLLPIAGTVLRCRRRA